jgi:hypothetical protein
MYFSCINIPFFAVLSLPFFLHNSSFFFTYLFFVNVFLFLFMYVRLCVRPSGSCDPCTYVHKCCIFLVSQIFNMKMFFQRQVSSRAYRAVGGRTEPDSSLWRDTVGRRGSRAPLRHNHVTLLWRDRLNVLFYDTIVTCTYYCCVFLFAKE